MTETLTTRSPCLACWNLLSAPLAVRLAQSRYCCKHILLKAHRPLIVPSTSVAFLLRLQASTDAYNLSATLPSSHCIAGAGNRSGTGRPCLQNTQALHELRLDVQQVNGKGTGAVHKVRKSHNACHKASRIWEQCAPTCSK